MSQSRTIAGLVLFGILCSCLTLPTHAQLDQIAPSETAVRVAIDPRVELISIIFRLAGNPEYCQGKVAAYINDVDEHFGPFRNHAVVQLARQLRRTRGVSYDACMSMAVHLTDASDLKEKIPFDPHPPTLDGRWRVDEAREFLQKARQFVEDTSFDEFVDKHQTMYRLTESRMKKVLDEEAHLEWFDQFFGRRPQASFSVILGLVNGGQCYGPRCRADDAKEDLYCVLGVWKTDGEGMPTFDREVLSTVVHEFCHSYANPIIDQHEAELRVAGQKIFPHVSSAMQRQAYGNWKTMMCESLVRACVVRYIRRHDGAVAAWMEIQKQKQRQFLWMKELSDLLGEYETARDEYPSLEKFAPQIVSFFDDYAKGFADKQKELDAKRPQVVAMTPANGAVDVDPSLSAIKVVFDRPMQDGSWSMVGGGPNFPEIVGKPAYDATKMVWTVSVKLKPDWRYQFMLNSGRFTSFRSSDGEPLAPVSVSFRTGKTESRD